MAACTCTMLVIAYSYITVFDHSWSSLAVYRSCISYVSGVWLGIYKLVDVLAVLCCIIIALHILKILTVDQHYYNLSVDLGPLIHNSENNLLWAVARELRVELVLVETRPQSPAYAASKSCIHSVCWDRISNLALVHGIVERDGAGKNAMCTRNLLGNFLIASTCSIIASHEAVGYV